MSYSLGPARFRALAVVLALAAVGCACSHNTLPRQSIRQIEPGLTTQVEIREWLGEPDDIAVDALGASRWEYHRQTRSRVKEHLGRWFLGPVSYVYQSFLMFPPSRPATEPPRRESLGIDFSPDGVVTRFEHRAPRPG